VVGSKRLHYQLIALPCETESWPIGPLSQAAYCDCEIVHAQDLVVLHFHQPSPPVAASFLRLGTDTYSRNRLKNAGLRSIRTSLSRNARATTGRLKGLTTVVWLHFLSSRTKLKLVASALCQLRIRVGVLRMDFAVHPRGAAENVLRYCGAFLSVLISGDQVADGVDQSNGSSVFVLCQAGRFQYSQGQQDQRWLGSETPSGSIGIVLRRS
jgi:hypothetical protein